MLSSFHLPTLGLNWIDLLILSIILFYAVEGYFVGVFTSVADFLGFILSFIIALKTYGLMRVIILKVFTIPQGIAQAIGFFIAAFVSELFLSFLFRRILHRAFLERLTFAPLSLRRTLSILGIIPGILSGLILLSFLLTLIIALPFAPFFKHAVSNSKIGSTLVANTQGVEKNINSIFGGAIEDTLNFLTVEPEGNDTINLNFRTADIHVDTTAENVMLQLVNSERIKRGLPLLTMDPSLQDVGREHSKDMFERGYFSHYTLEGLSPFDRMAKAGISYTFAGENLALAPNTNIAMQGLMNSPGHRANMLSANFRKIGIGVYESDAYGEMFSQEFTD